LVGRGLGEENPEVVFNVSGVGTDGIVNTSYDEEPT
jgi:hypothetical protein